MPRLMACSASSRCWRCPISNPSSISSFKAMEQNRYTICFLGTVMLVIAAGMGFTWPAAAYILGHRAFGSVQTLSGFERALKPVWLAQIRPELVFVGSSRVRDGFDPVLIDPALKTRSFNYGASSLAPYEARRFVQDALAQPSV